MALVCDTALVYDTALVCDNEAPCMALALGNHDMACENMAFLLARIDGSTGSSVEEPLVVAEGDTAGDDTIRPLEVLAAVVGPVVSKVAEQVQL